DLFGSHYAGPDGARARGRFRASDRVGQDERPVPGPSRLCTAREAVMEADLQLLVDGCIGAHRRLLATLEVVDDATARGLSQLPAWTRGHVLTHLARNADS